MISRQAPCIRGDSSLASLRVLGGMAHSPNPGLGHLYPAAKEEPLGTEGACALTQGQHFRLLSEFTKCRDIWGPFPPRVGLPSPPWACMRALSRGLVTATAGAVAPSPAS